MLLATVYCGTLFTVHENVNAKPEKALNMKGIIVTSALLASLVGCGTVKTIDPINDHVVIEKNGSKSYCTSLYRVYSGVGYNACRAFNDSLQPIDWGSTIVFPIVVIDTACSAVADTILLPYTIIRQYNEGSIAVN